MMPELWEKVSMKLVQGGQTKRLEMGKDQAGSLGTQEKPYVPKNRKQYFALRNNSPRFNSSPKKTG
jgi:hypothetical protein